MLLVYGLRPNTETPVAITRDDATILATVVIESVAVAPRDVIRESRLVEIQKSQQTAA